MPEDPALNGIRPDGGYAYPGPDDAEVARWLVPPEPPPGSRLRAPGRSIDAGDLSEAGWAVVYPAGEGPRYEPLLRDLLDLRREQAGELYRRIDLIPNETCDYFLERLRANTGQADPDRLPYYVLLVGSPRQIPFEFQGLLDQVYAVGRLHFEEDEHYEAYARSVREAETRPTREPRRRVTLFGALNGGDGATLRTTERLVEPLASEVERRVRGRNGWRVERIVGPEATRDALAALLTGTDAPDLLFTAGHGMVFGPDDPSQAALQGALLCSDWPGPGHPLERGHYLAAEDLTIRGRPLHGSIAFHLACHSGGTPVWDSFHPPDVEERRRLAHRPFVSALPQRLLAEAGALAVVAHVDRAWTTSFDWNPGDDEPNPKVFRDTVLPLVNGCRVGDATESLGTLYGFLATRVKEHLEQTRGRELGPGGADPARGARLWRATNDVRSFVVFGDPAVRLGGGRK